MTEYNMLTILTRPRVAQSCSEWRVDAGGGGCPGVRVTTV